MSLLQTNWIVEPSWLARPSLRVAPDLLGCTLVRRLPDGELVRGMIVETEAYGPDDPACHAYQKRTLRNGVMFGPAGFSYIYLIYGIYCCFNVITDLEGVASAVLIRALELETLPSWVECSSERQRRRVGAGPGKLCQVLKIDRSLSGLPLQFGEPLWLEHRTPAFQETLNQGKLTFIPTTRIGLTKGVELPWRWYLANSPAISKP